MADRSKPPSKVYRTFHDMPTALLTEPRKGRRGTRQGGEGEKQKEWRYPKKEASPQRSDDGSLKSWDMLEDDFVEELRDGWEDLGSKVVMEKLREEDVRESSKKEKSPTEREDDVLSLAKEWLGI